jgi:O-antigen/teichoic acid export membrane protein
MRQSRALLPFRERVLEEMISNGHIRCSFYCIKLKRPSWGIVTVSLSSNTLSSALAGAITTMGTFVCSVFIARFKGAAGSGVVSFAIASGLFIATIGDMGLSATMTRFLPELRALGKHSEVAGFTARLLFFALLFSGALVITGLVITFSAPLEAFAKLGAAQSLWALIAVLSASQILAFFAIGYLRGMQDFDALLRVSAASALIQVFIVATCAATSGAEWALIGYIVGNFITAAVCIPVARSRGTVTGERRRLAFIYARNSWAAAVVSYFVWARLDILFVGAFSTTEDVGRLSVALTLAGAAMQLPLLLTGALLPHFASLAAIGRHEEVGQQYAMVTLIIALIAAPLCFGCAAIAPSLLPLIFGKAFTESGPLAQIVVVATFFGALSLGGSSVLYGRDQSLSIFIFGLVGAALFVLAGFTIIREYGAEGAAWTRALLQTLLVVGGFIYIRIKFGYRISIWKLSSIICSAALCAFAAAVTLRFVGGWTGVSISVFVGAGVYSFALKFTGVLDVEMRQGVARSISSFPPKVRRFVSQAVTLLANGTS